MDWDARLFLNPKSEADLISTIALRIRHARKIMYEGTNRWPDRDGDGISFENAYSRTLAILELLHETLEKHGF